MNSDFLWSSLMGFCVCFFFGWVLCFPRGFLGVRLDLRDCCSSRSPRPLLIVFMRASFARMSSTGSVFLWVVVLVERRVRLSSSDSGTVRLLASWSGSKSDVFSSRRAKGILTGLAIPGSWLLEPRLGGEVGFVHVGLARRLTVHGVAVHVGLLHTAVILGLDLGDQERVHGCWWVLN